GGCWSGVLCYRINYDLCLAIAAAQTLGNRYGLSHCRLHYYGRHFGGLALVFFSLTVTGNRRPQSHAVTAQQFFTGVVISRRIARVFNIERVPPCIVTLVGRVDCGSPTKPACNARGRSGKTSAQSA